MGRFGSIFSRIQGWSRRRLMGFFSQSVSSSAGCSRLATGQAKQTRQRLHASAQGALSVSVAKNRFVFVQVITARVDHTLAVEHYRFLGPWAAHGLPAAFMQAIAGAPAPRTDDFARSSRVLSASSSALIMPQPDNGRAMLVIVEYWNYATAASERAQCSKHSGALMVFQVDTSKGCRRYA